MEYDALLTVIKKANVEYNADKQLQEVIKLEEYIANQIHDSFMGTVSNYSTKQSILTLVDEMIEKLNSEDMIDPVKDYYRQVVEAKLKIGTLTELKGKIEAL